MTGFALPDLGEGLQDAEIVAWHVAVGDHVVADQPLVSVETEKAVVEVPSPHAGRIAALHGAVGARVAVGATLVEFEDGGHADTGTVVGELAPTPAAHAPASPAPPPPAIAAPVVKAAPAVRALAQKLGVDLARVAPTGPDGAVTRADVEAAARQRPPEAPSDGTAVVEPLKGSRWAMALNMARAGAAVVPATVVDEADIEAWRDAQAVTVRLIRAVVAGCAASPALNAWYDAATQTRRLHENVDLGLAVDSADGLFVPVLRDVARLSDAALAAAIETAKDGVRRRNLAPAELRGQTITVSNFGTLAGRFAALAVIPPQVAILGAGRIAARAVVRDGAVAAHRLLPLSLTFDHRVVTGGEAARFLAAAIADLEKPE